MTSTTIPTGLAGLATCSLRKRSDAQRVCVGWCLLVVAMSVMVYANGDASGSMPWTATWLCYLPSLMALGYGSQSRGCIPCQCGLAMVSAAFIAGFFYTDPSLMPLQVATVVKFMPVALAIFITAIVHILIKLRSAATA